MESIDHVLIRKFESKDQNEVIKHFLEGKLNKEDEFSKEVKALNEWFAKAKLSLDMEEIYTHYISPKDSNVHCFWVAEDTITHEILGFVGAIPCTYNQLEINNPLAPNLSSNKYLELVRMTVAKNAKRKGIGSKLIANFEIYAKELGFQGIYLTTLLGMNDAVSFYYKNGFQNIFIELQKTKNLPNFDHINHTFETFEVVHFIKDF